MPISNTGAAIMISFFLPADFFFGAAGASASAAGSSALSGLPLRGFAAHAAADMAEKV